MKQQSSLEHINLKLGQDCRQTQVKVGARLKRRAHLALHLTRPHKLPTAFDDYHTRTTERYAGTDVVL